MFSLEMAGIVEIDVGGTIFKTKKETLNRIPGSLLGKLDMNSKKAQTFDRDPNLFRYILNAHRTGDIHVPRDVCPRLFKQEMEYWNLPLHLLSPCCWKYFYEADGDVQTFQILLEAETTQHSQNKICLERGSIRKAFQDLNRRTKETAGSTEQNIQNDLLSKMWLFLDNPASSTSAKIWCFFYTLVVVLSVLIYIIWLAPSLRRERYLSSYMPGWNVYKNSTTYDLFVEEFNEKLVLLGLSDPHPALLGLDIACVAFFSFETALHFVCCPNKLRYFMNVYHVFKIILCCTMIILTILEFRKDVFASSLFLSWFYFICRSLNVLRLLLIFRLHLIFNGLHVMLLSIKQSLKELLLLLFCFAAAVVMFGCLVFSTEIDTEMFPSTQVAMWWSLITMTTIGYGDFYPTSAAGYIVGVMCAISGLIVLAMPIAALAGTFSNIYNRNADFKSHKLAIEKQKYCLQEHNEGIAAEHTLSDEN